MLLERLPRAGVQVHSEGAPREGGGREVGGREGAGREMPLRGEPQREGREEGAEALELGVHQAKQGPTTQGPIPWGNPHAPSLASLHLFPSLPGVQCHLEETHWPVGNCSTHPNIDLWSCLL